MIDLLSWFLQAIGATTVLALFVCLFFGVQDWISNLYTTRKHHRAEAVEQRVNSLWTSRMSMIQECLLEYPSADSAVIDLFEQLAMEESWSLEVKRVLETTRYYRSERSALAEQSEARLDCMRAGLYTVPAETKEGDRLCRECGGGRSTHVNGCLTSKAERPLVVNQCDQCGQRNTTFGEPLRLVCISCRYEENE